MQSASIIKQIMDLNSNLLILGMSEVSKVKDSVRKCFACVRYNRSSKQRTSVLTSISFVLVGDGAFLEKAFVW